jgi:hypothetical protein
VRERTQGRLNGRNSVGADLGARVTWTGRDSLFGVAHLRPMVSVGHREVIGMRFADDLYGLAFFGNAPYEDATAYLGPTAHLAIRYQSMGFGIADATSGSYLRLDVVQGQSFNASDIPFASLYTAPDGIALEVDLVGEYWSSDTASSAFGRNNGMGLGISGRIVSRHDVGGTPMDVSFEVNDLGFVAWNPRAVRLYKDTTAYFEGFQVENVLDLDGVLVGEGQLLDTFGLRYRENAFNTILPFRAALGVNLQFAERWQAGLVIEQRNLPGFEPQITLSGSRRMGQRTLLGASLGYGGFGKLRLGLAMRTRIGERIHITLATSQVPAWITTRTMGLGAMAGIGVGF